MSEFSEHVTTEQCYAIEFRGRGSQPIHVHTLLEKFRALSSPICRSGLPSTELTGEPGSLSRLLSVVSIRADIVACSGRSIDKMPCYTRSVESCFRFNQLDLPCLLHKSSYSVFGHIDYFSVPMGLVTSLGSSLTEDWVQRSPELVRVSINYLL